MNANFPRRIVHPAPPGHLLKRASQPRARREEVAGRDLVVGDLVAMRATIITTIADRGMALMALFTIDYRMLRLLKFSPFERRGDRWRFGTRTIGDSVVARLIASGRAEIIGKQLCLTVTAPIGVPIRAIP